MPIPNRGHIPVDIHTQEALERIRAFVGDGFHFTSVTPTGQGYHIQARIQTGHAFDFEFQYNRNTGQINIGNSGSTVRSVVPQLGQSSEELVGRWMQGYVNARPNYNYRNLGDYLAANHSADWNRGQYINSGEVMSFARERMIASRRSFMPDEEGHIPAFAEETLKKHEDLFGGQYSRQKDSTHGPSVEATFGSAQGAINRGSNLLPGTPFETMSQKADAAGTLKQVKAMQQAGVQQHGFFVGRDRKPLPQFNSPFTQEVPTGKIGPDGRPMYTTEIANRGSVIRMGYVTDQPFPEGMGLVTHNSMIGGIAEDRVYRDARKPGGYSLGVPAAEAVTGRHKLLETFPGQFKSTGDWDYAEQVGTNLIQTEHEDILERTFRLYAGSGDWRLITEGNKIFTAGRAKEGAYNSPKSGVDLLAAPNTIKADLAYWQNALAGGVLAGHARFLGLERALENGAIPWNEQNLKGLAVPALEKMVHDTPSNPFWTNTPSGGRMFAPYLLTNPSRSGAYSWNDPRYNAELSSRLQNLDPKFAEQMQAQSTGRQEIFGEIINSASQISGLPIRPLPSQDISSLTGVLKYKQLWDGQGEGGQDKYRQILNTLAPLLQEVGIDAKTVLNLTAVAGNKQVSIPLGSLRTLKYLSGDQFAPQIAGQDREEGGGTDLQSGMVKTVLRMVLTHAATGGQVDPADLKSYENMMRAMGTSKGIHGAMKSLYPQQAFGGPVGGDYGVPENVIAVPDEILQRLAGTSGPAAGESLKSFLTEEQIAAWVMRNPNQTDEALVRLRVMPFSSLPKLEVSESSRAFVHPSVQSLFNGDFDVDAILASIAGGVKRRAEGWVNQTTLPPMTIQQINNVIDQAEFVGAGKAELRKWKKDLGEWQGKPEEFLMQKVESLKNRGWVKGTDLQGSYGRSLTFGLGMGITFNWTRRLEALTGGEGRQALGLSPLYQSNLDKTLLNDPMMEAFDVMNGLQPATGNTKPGLFSGVFRKFGFRTGSVTDAASGIGNGKNNEAMKAMLVRFVQGSEMSAREQFAGDPDAKNKLTEHHRFIAGMLISDQTQARLLADALDMTGDENNPGLLSAQVGAVLTATLGNTPWEDAASLGSFTTMVRAQRSAAWDEEKFPMSPADKKWAILGRALNSTTSVLSNKFKSAEHMLESYAGAGLAGNFSKLAERVARMSGLPQGRSLAVLAGDVGYHHPGLEDPTMPAHEFVVSVNGEQAAVLTALDDMPEAQRAATVNNITGGRQARFRPSSGPANVGVALPAFSPDDGSSGVRMQAMRAWNTANLSHLSGGGFGTPHPLGSMEDYVNYQVESYQRSMASAANAPRLIGGVSGYTNVPLSGPRLSSPGGPRPPTPPPPTGGNYWDNPPEEPGNGNGGPPSSASRASPAGMSPTADYGKQMFDFMKRSLGMYHEESVNRQMKLSAPGAADAYASSLRSILETGNYDTQTLSSGLGPGSAGELGSTLPQKLYAALKGDSGLRAGGQKALVTQLGAMAFGNAANMSPEMAAWTMGQLPGHLLGVENALGAGAGKKHRGFSTTAQGGYSEPGQTDDTESPGDYVPKRFEEALQRATTGFERLNKTVIDSSSRFSELNEQQRATLTQQKSIMGQYGQAANNIQTAIAGGMPAEGTPLYRKLQSGQSTLAMAQAAEGNMGGGPPGGESSGLFGEGGAGGFAGRMMSGFKMFYLNRIRELATGTGSEALNEAGQLSLQGTQGLYQAGIGNGQITGTAGAMIGWQNNQQRAESTLGNSVYATYGGLVSAASGGAGSLGASLAVNVGLPAVGAGLLAGAIGDAAGTGALSLLAAPEAFPLIAGTAALALGANWVAGQSRPENAPNRIQTMMRGGGGMATTRPGIPQIFPNDIGQEIAYGWANQNAAPGEQAIAEAARKVVDNYGTAGGAGLVGMSADTRSEAVQQIAAKYFPTMGVEQSGQFIPQLTRYGNISLQARQALGAQYAMGTDVFGAAATIGQAQGISQYNTQGQTGILQGLANMTNPNIQAVSGVYSQYGQTINQMRLLGQPDQVVTNGTPYFEHGAFDSTQTQTTTQFTELQKRSPSQAQWYANQVQTNYTRKLAGLTPIPIPSMDSLSGDPSNAANAASRQNDQRTQIATSAWSSAMSAGYSGSFATSIQSLADQNPYQANVVMQAMQGPGNQLSSMVSGSAAFSSSPMWTPPGIPPMTGAYARTQQTGGLSGAAGLPIGTTSVFNQNGSIISQYKPILMGGDPGAVSALMGGRNFVNTLSPVQLASFGGQNVGGTQALQYYAENQSYASAMVGIGIQGAQANLSWKFQSGVGLNENASYPGMVGGPRPVQSQWAIQDQQISMQRAQAQWGIDLSGARLSQSVSNYNQTDAFNRNYSAVQYGFQQQNFGFQAQSMAMGRSQQLENFGLQREEMGIQRNAQQQNWAFAQHSSNVGFAFEMRDDDISIRRSSGFERQQLIRQKEEQTSAHNIDTQGRKMQESQAKKEWAEEDKRFSVSKRQAEEVYKLSVTQFEAQKKQAAELYKLELSRYDMQKSQFMANAALDAADIAKQQEWLIQKNKLDDASRDNERTFATQQHGLQMAAIGNQAAQLTNAKKIQELQEAIDLANKTQQGTLGYLFQTSWDWVSQMSVWMTQLGNQAAGGGAPTQGSHPKGPPGSDNPNDLHASGFQGMVKSGTRLSVGEQGAEELYVSVSPFKVPGFAGHTSRAGNGGGGDTHVHVYLDSKEISRYTVKQISQQIYKGRKS